MLFHSRWWLLSDMFLSLFLLHSSAFVMWFLEHLDWVCFPMKIKCGGDCCVWFLPLSGQWSAAILEETVICSFIMLIIFLLKTKGSSVVFLMSTRLRSIFILFRKVMVQQAKQFDILYCSYLKHKHCRRQVVCQSLILDARDQVWAIVIVMVVLDKCSICLAVCVCV